MKKGMQLYKELRLQGAHCLYTVIKSEVRNWQSEKKWQKLKDYIQTTCTSPDHGEMCKVSKRSV